MALIGTKTHVHGRGARAGKVQSVLYGRFVCMDVCMHSAVPSAYTVL